MCLTLLVFTLKTQRSWSPCCTGFWQRASLLTHFAPGSCNDALKASLVPNVFAYKKGVESTSFEQGGFGSWRISLSGSRTVAAVRMSDLVSFMEGTGKSHDDFTDVCRFFRAMSSAQVGVHAAVRKSSETKHTHTHTEHPPLRIPS